MTTARIAATRALLSVTLKQETLGSAIDRERRALEDSRDRGLALELTAGTLRWRAAIDFVIEDASGRSITAIDGAALAVLRIGVYQLRYLERVPDHAVVSESVEAIRAVGAPRGAGFVNAVLRKAIRRRHVVRLPPPVSEHDSRQSQVAYLGTSLSHPRWLIERWLDRFGYTATRRFCEWNNSLHSVTVRPREEAVSVDRLLDDLAAAGVPATRSPFVDDALRLPAGALGRLGPELGTRLRVQDEGAQLVARAAGVSPGERVLDLCAAPGGKSLVLRHDLSRGGRPGLLVSSDFRRGRVALLARTLGGDRSAPIVRLDARAALPFGPVFDCVLADVPCSGLGTLRRDPDLKWTRTADDLAALAKVEGVILRRAASVVRPGGRLVYATCSSEPEENEAVVDAFLDDDRTFVPGDLGPAIPATLQPAQGRLLTRPDRDGLDLFFAAVLVRR